MFKLSLRELFLLVALAAVGTAWWLDRSRLAASHLVVESELTASKAATASEQAKVLFITKKLSRLIDDARTACRHHGLSVNGTGANAHPAENDGTAFHR